MTLTLHSLPQQLTCGTHLSVARAIVEPRDAPWSLKCQPPEIHKETDNWQHNSKRFFKIETSFRDIDQGEKEGEGNFSNIFEEFPSRWPTQPNATNNNHQVDERNPRILLLEMRRRRWCTKPVPVYLATVAAAAVACGLRNVASAWFISNFNGPKILISNSSRRISSPLW